MQSIKKELSKTIYEIHCVKVRAKAIFKLLCLYAKNSCCPSGKSLHIFKTVQDATSHLQQHASSHKQGKSTVNFQPQLPIAARSKISEAPALAVCLDIQPISFNDGHTGLRKFALTIFEMGQSVQANEKIDRKSYMPGRTAIIKTAIDLSNRNRKNFIAELKGGHYNTVER